MVMLVDIEAEAKNIKSSRFVSNLIAPSD